MKGGKRFYPPELYKMKKIALLIISLFLTLHTAFAIEDTASSEEVVLDFPAEEEEVDNTIHDELEELGYETVPEHSEIQKEKTLREKLEDIYHLEVKDIDKNNFLLTDIVTKHFSEDSIIKSIHPFAGYNGNLNFIFNQSDSFQTKYGFNAVNVGFDGVFKNDVADFRFLTSFQPLSHRNMVRNLFSDVYVGTNKIPQHRVQVGYQRPGNGMEGKISAYQIPFLYRSQISRNFGTVRKIGARVIGDYSLIEYDIGGYSSDTYMKSFFPGAEFDGWVNFKPLGKTNGKYGKLKIGGGIQGGKRHTDYFLTGAYVSYEYKKFMVDFEWANANGYNGSSGHVSDKHAGGFYTTVSYRLTPKVQLLARYDQFDPDRHVRHNSKREYSLGINYFIKGPGLRLIFNYIFCQNDAAKDSHRLMVGTQILL